MLRRHANKRIMPNVWMAPGGHREYCEGLFECARREVMEETGIEITNIRCNVTGVVYMKDIDEEIFLHLLMADYAGGEPKLDTEDGELVWLTAEEIYQLKDLLSELREVLPYVFSDQTKLVSYKAMYEKGNQMVDFAIERS